MKQAKSTSMLSPDQLQLILHLISIQTADMKIGKYHLAIGTRKETAKQISQLLIINKKQQIHSFNQQEQVFCTWEDATINDIYCYFFSEQNQDLEDMIHLPIKRLTQNYWKQFMKQRKKHLSLLDRKRNGQNIKEEWEKIKSDNEYSDSKLTCSNLSKTIILKLRFIILNELDANYKAKLRSYPQNSQPNLTINSSAQKMFNSSSPSNILKLAPKNLSEIKEVSNSAECQSSFNGDLLKHLNEVTPPSYLYSVKTSNSNEVDDQNIKLKRNKTFNSVSSDPNIDEIEWYRTLEHIKADEKKRMKMAINFESSSDTSGSQSESKICKKYIYILIVLMTVIGLLIFRLKGREKGEKKIIKGRRK